MLKRPIQVRIMGQLSYVLPEVLGWHDPGAAEWLEVVPTRAGRADVVVTVIGPGDEEAAVAEARRHADSAPVLAILPMRDEALARRVMAAGANGWFALGDPPAMLPALLAAVVAHRDVEEHDRC